MLGLDPSLGCGVCAALQSGLAGLETAPIATRTPLQPAARLRASARSGGLRVASGCLESQPLLDFLRRFASGKANASVSFRITDEEHALLAGLSVGAQVSVNDKARHLVRRSLAVHLALPETMKRETRYVLVDLTTGEELLLADCEADLDQLRQVLDVATEVRPVLEHFPQVHRSRTSGIYGAKRHTNKR